MEAGIEWRVTMRWCVLGDMASGFCIAKLYHINCKKSSVKGSHSYCSAGGTLGFPRFVGIGMYGTRKGQGAASLRSAGSPAPDLFIEHLGFIPRGGGTPFRFATHPLQKGAGHPLAARSHGPSQPFKGGPAQLGRPRVPEFGGHTSPPPLEVRRWKRPARAVVRRALSAPRCLTLNRG